MGQIFSIEEEPDRAVQVGQKEKYNLFRDNCEDLAPSLRYVSPENEQVEEEPAPKPGDLAAISRSLYKHYAIAVDKEHVVHPTRRKIQDRSKECSSESKEAL